MTDRQALLAALTPEQRRALLARLRPPASDVAGQVTARPRASPIVPLSSSQERMWFLEQMQPGLPLHVMTGVVRLPRALEPEVFAECLDEVVTRHESLRTTFLVEDGLPVARISDRVQVPLAVYDGVTPESMWRSFGEDARRPFDIARGPLVRAGLAVDDAGRCYVQLSLHHLVSDGYSTGILFGELGALCAGRVMSARAMLAPLPFQYADYAAWHSDRLAAGDLASDLAYWTKHLQGAPPGLSLPADRPRPGRMSYRGERLTFEVDAARRTGASDLGRAHGLTPFVVLLAAYAATLARWATQDEVVVGVPVALRDQPGTERVIGPFLNTLALRIDLAGDPSVAELLACVGEAVRGGLEHQDTPFDEVVKAVGATRDLSRPPLFQAVFNHQPDVGGRELELTDLSNGCVQVDVLFNLVPEGDGIRGIVDYSSDLYDESTVRRLTTSFLSALDAMCEDPAAAVSGLPLDDRSLPSTPLSVPPLSAPSVPAAVLDTAGRHPGRTALVDARQRLTYGELSQRSETLAHALRGLVGPVPGAHVALCLPRSVEMVVAILATLRAGYTFVPLDPTFPTARLEMICADAGAAAVVSTSDLREVLGELGLPRVELDQVDLVADGTACVCPPDAAVAERAAYTIYTSGTTGRPKGVSVSHANLVSLLDAMRVEPGLAPSDVLLSVTTPSFDIALLEMLLPLTVGARTVFADADDVLDGRRLAGLIEAHDVTVMQGTPSTWQLMVDAGWPGAPGLVALCGGEALPVSLARALLPRCAALWNMYGPTETTIWSSVHEVTAADVDAGVIPLGHAIRGTELHLLDAGDHPVPDGVYGQLCIAGAGVSLGYHQRPDLTAERFVRLPGTAGRVLYRTGDRARIGPRGELEFGGRVDLQVKVRGFRIELGEVETALEACDGVGRAVASVHGAEDLDHSVLTAHLEPTHPGALDTERVRAQLATVLPAYMVPSRWTVHDRLPRTDNGKIDRAALARASTAGGTTLAPVDGHGSTGPHLAPRTELERALADIWREVLGLSSAPGMTEDFFQIGGHSLLATKLVFSIRGTLGLDVPLPVLFAGSLTIERLAQMLSESQEARSEDQAEERLDLAAEARLAEDLRPLPGAHVHSVRDPQNPLLTGATGFVGAFLLRQLLEHTTASVHCLVRAASARDGLHRIRESLSAYEIWDEAYVERIVPVVGSLARPRLGLSRPAWAHLAALVDVIYHCGAEVNFLQPYETLRAANVRGTEEVIRLACAGGVKPVHFVSSTYVFSRFAYPEGTRFTEDMSPIHDLEHTFGYTQTKWVSEQMVLEAGRRGLPVYVYRTGRVAGHSGTGACQVYDFVWQSTRLGIQMAATPVMDIGVELTPVDYVAAAIVHLSRRTELAGQVFHVVSPSPLTQADLVERMEAYGYRGERLSFDEWCRRVVARADTLDDDAATALAPFLSGALPLDKIPDATFDDGNVRRGLEGSGITCPDVSDGLLRTYFDWFVKTGYLPPPDTVLDGALDESGSLR